MRRSLRLLSVLALAGGCASATTPAQWRANESYWACLRTCCEVAGPYGRYFDTGGSLVAYTPTPDGILYYTPLQKPEAETRLAECFRTKYPDLKVIQGSPPK